MEGLVLILSPAHLDASTHTTISLVVAVAVDIWVHVVQRGAMWRAMVQSVTANVVDVVVSIQRVRREAGTVTRRRHRDWCATLSSSASEHGSG